MAFKIIDFEMEGKSEDINAPLLTALKPEANTDTSLQSNAKQFQTTPLRWQILLALFSIFFV